MQRFKLPKPIDGEPTLLVSRSQLIAMLRGAAQECTHNGPEPGSTARTIDQLSKLDFDMPPGFSVTVVDSTTLTVTSTIENEQVTVRVQSNGFMQERILYMLAMHFLRRRGDELDEQENTRALVREIDQAINGRDGMAKQASLCDIASQIVTAARNRGKPLLAD